MSEVSAIELDEKFQKWWLERYCSDKKWFAKDLLADSKNMESKVYVLGNGKQLLSPFYYKNKDYVKNMEIREKDVWIFGFPRSGTTLTQEMVWLLDHSLDFETAKKMKLNYRSVFLESAFFIPEGSLKELRAKLADEGFDYFDRKQQIDRPSPRHFKTHLFFELLPDNLVDKAKVFYLAREVKDVIVSMFHFEKYASNLANSMDFKTYCLDFIQDHVCWGPYFTHLKEGWSKRNHPNVMFMFYEDMVSNLPGTIQRVTKFLDKDYSEDQLEALYQHLRFDNMKNNDAVNPADLNRYEYKNKDAQPFIRQGKSGTWREYFDDELLEKTEAWIAKNLADSDIKFPTT